MSSVCLSVTVHFGSQGRCAELKVVCACWQDAVSAVSTLSAVNDIIKAVADQMASLLVYASTGGSPIFGTVSEIFLVHQLQILSHQRNTNYV